MLFVMFTAIRIWHDSDFLFISDKFVEIVVAMFLPSRYAR